MSENTAQLEQVDCILCQQMNSRTLPYFHHESPIGNLELHQCRTCGLIYQNPRLPERMLDRLYDQDYFEHGEFGGKDKTRSYFNPREQKDLLRFYQRVLSRIARIKPTPATLLEIGCAGGHFLLQARQLGYSVHGIEISEYASEQARSRYGLDVLTGTLETTAMPEKSCDIIYLKDVLEHVRNPLTFLEECRRILKPDGLIVILVPSYINSPIMRLYITIWNRSPRLRALIWSNRGKFLLDKPFHLFEFTEKTLSMIVVKAGYSILSVENYTRPPLYSHQGFLITNLVRFFVRWLYFFMVSLSIVEGDRLELYCQPRDPKATV
ncbi:methyltransferase domain-containing protein [bacterium]|nr:methyltransferase domain-containing protein [bacterium]